MSVPLIWLVTAIYMYVGGEQYLIGNEGIGIMYVAYGVANLGILKAMGSL